MLTTKRSLILSNGAITVFAQAPAIPPNKCIYKTKKTILMCSIAAWITAMIITLYMPYSKNELKIISMHFFSPLLTMAIGYYIARRRC